MDRQGKVVLLAGAHDGWELQDYAWGDHSQGVRFDWRGFLDFLVEHHHNVIRLWSVEHTKIVDADPDLTRPMPYERVSGHGKARDGQNKFDLDRFNPAYFDRLRSRVDEARARGIYVIVMLFDGWSVEDKGGKVNPWPYHPFHADNNINGMNGDLDGDGQGRDLHTWQGESNPVTRRQRAYMEKVMETVGDLDNVLYEVSNESHPGSMAWQNQCVKFIHEKESARPMRHPVGITVPFGSPRRPGLNEELFRSEAEWISPNREAPGKYNYRDNPPPGDGRKVVLSDSDHLYGNKLNRDDWVWKTFFRGHNLFFMDRWTEEPTEPGRQRVRQALGLVRQLADTVDLRFLVPRVDLASTRYSLAGPREYLIYQPGSGSFTVDLSQAPPRLSLTWFNPRTGVVQKGGTLVGGGKATLQAPFAGPAVARLERLP
jgi:Family of unknown function (DUF6298)